MNGNDDDMCAKLLFIYMYDDAKERIASKNQFGSPISSCIVKIRSNYIRLSLSFSLNWDDVWVNPGEQYWLESVHVLLAHLLGVLAEESLPGPARQQIRPPKETWLQKRFKGQRYRDLKSLISMDLSCFFWHNLQRGATKSPTHVPK